MSKYSENMPPDIAGAIGWVYKLIRPKSTLLDFGCSTGYFGAYIKNNKDCKVYGVEVSDDQKEAKKVLDGVYSFDLDGEWPEKVYERQYDYLFFGDVLEHLKSPVSALKKARRLLKPNGKIFVSIPNIAHMSIRLELLRGSFIYESMGILDNTHLQYVTLSTFTAYANDAGYNAKLIDYTVNDIPQDVTEKTLREMGLQADEKFWKETQKIEARAYQFKFELEPSKKPNSKPINSINEQLKHKPLQYRDDLIRDFQAQITAIDNHAREQAKIIDHFKHKAEQLETQKSILERKIEVLEKPIVPRLTSRLRNAARKLNNRGASNNQEDK